MGDLAEPSHSLPRKKAKGENVDISTISAGETYENNSELLLQLGYLQGGLTESQLSAILCKCTICGRIFTKHVFYTYHLHSCTSST